MILSVSVFVLPFSSIRAYAAENAQKVQITGAVVNVRKGAGTNYTISCTVKKNAVYDFISKTTVDGKEWYQIRYNSSKTGWICGTYAKFLDSSSTTSAATVKTAVGTTIAAKKAALELKVTSSGNKYIVTVTASTVVVRKGAGTSYGKIATVKKGRVFDYISEKKDKKGTTWYQIQYSSSVKAWITGKYTKKSIYVAPTTTAKKTTTTSASTTTSTAASTTTQKATTTTTTSKSTTTTSIQKTTTTTQTTTIQTTASTTQKTTAQTTCTTQVKKNVMQEQVDAAAKSYKSVGIQVAVIRGSDNKIMTWNNGYATKSSSKLTADTKYKIASLSKIAVAVTAMKMQEQKIVNIDDNIAKYWNIKMPKAVTLRNILTHTSTLKDLSYKTTKSSTMTQLKSSSSYKSGTVGSKSSWQYNNYAVGIAGSTLEVASNKKIDAYTKTNIFTPLGMDASFFSGMIKDTGKLGTLYNANDTVHRSVSSSKAKKSGAIGANTKYFAGGLTLSAKDMAKLLSMLANDGSYNGVRILSPASVETIEKVQFNASEHGGTFGQAMPLRYKANLYNSSKLYYHTGNACGILSLGCYNPDTHDVVVVVTSGASATRDSQGVYAVCSSIAKTAFANMQSL